MPSAFPTTGQKPFGPTLQNYIKARTPINVAEDYGTTSANVLSAVAAAKAAKRGLLFAGNTTFAITGDLTLDWDDAYLAAPDGTSATLNFTNGGLVLDGTATWRFRTGLSNLLVNRAGTAGPALYLKGGGASTGPSRGYFENVRIESSTGDALKVAGGYTHTFVNCYLRGATLNGLTVMADPIAGTVFGNALNFLGCEIQGNGKAMELTSSQCVTFVGGAIEGNTQGMELIDNARNTHFYNVYVEGNGAGSGDYDLKVGTTTSCTGLVVSGGFWNDASKGKGRSIQLVRATGVRITEAQFAGFGANSPVAVAEATAGAVTGEVLNNVTNGSVPVTTLGTCVTVKSKILKGSAVLTYGAIATTASANLTITVTGAVVGDDVFCNPNGTPTAGIVYTWWVSAVDTVTVRATNITTGTITPTAVTWRAQVTNGSLSGS